MFPFMLETHIIFKETIDKTNIVGLISKEDTIHMHD